MPKMFGVSSYHWAITYVFALGSIISRVRDSAESPQWRPQQRTARGLAAIARPLYVGANHRRLLRKGGTPKHQLLLFAFSQTADWLFLK